MHIIATLWWPSLNPIGFSSLIAVGVCAAAWFAVERRFFRSERARGWVVIVVPLLLLALAFRFHSDFSRYRTFPDAQNFFACFICIAVSVALAWKASRLPMRDLRTLGICDLLFSVAFLAFESFSLYRRFYAA
jgi:hypothetical protein